MATSVSLRRETLESFFSDFLSSLLGWSSRVRAGTCRNELERIALFYMFVVQVR